MSKSSSPNFAFSLSTSVERRRRSARAAAWGAVFFGGLVLLGFLADGPSRLGRVAVITAWGLGVVVCQLVVSSDRRWPKHRWSRVLLACSSAALPAWLILIGSCGALHAGKPTASDIDAFLSDKTTRRAVLDWSEDAQSWSALVQAMPADAERDRHLDAFATTLAPLLEEGHFVIHDTLAAATDAGIMHGAVARALLTTPRRRANRPFREPKEAAQAWLADASRHDLTDDYEYACAAAVHDVLPESPELRAIVVGGLHAGEGPLVQDDSLRGLMHLVRMAELVGVSTDVPELPSTAWQRCGLTPLSRCFHARDSHSRTCRAAIRRATRADVKCSAAGPDFSGRTTVPCQFGASRSMGSHRHSTPLRMASAKFWQVTIPRLTRLHWTLPNYLPPCHVTSPVIASTSTTACEAPTEPELDRMNTNQYASVRVTSLTSTSLHPSCWARAHAATIASS